MKKSSKLEWRKNWKRTFIGTGDLTFRNKIKKSSWITFNKLSRNYYAVETNLERHIWKDFKTRKQALDFSKKLMRKHPRG